MTQEIQWGPAIAVDGKRPGFVRDEDAIDVRSDWVPKWYSDASGGNVISSSNIDWSQVAVMRLPADHPHYRQPAPIDWSGELEAVHEDGRVVAVRLSGFDQPDHDGDYSLSEFLDTRRSAGKYFKADGSQSYGYADGGRPWRIRNVTPQPTPQADTKPDVTARMEALVRDMAAPAFERITVGTGYGNDTGRAFDEARAIVALLPEPVDPDLIEARKIAAVWSVSQDVSHSHYLDGHMDDSVEVRGMVAALARGRELALAGETGK